MGFDENSFFSTALSVPPYWVHESQNENVAEKITNLSSTNKIALYCDVIDGSIQDGIRQPILFSFVSNKPSGYIIFFEHETFHYRKTDKSVLDTKTSYVEDDNNEEVNFNGETLTFTLKIDKINKI